MNWKTIIELLLLTMVVILAGCNGNDQVGNSMAKVNFDQLYFDYTITGEENNENVTCVFQYKYGDEEGKAINIQPAKMELDGEPVETDSARLSGFFYEVQKPVEAFTGKHTIVFETPNKTYRNEFEFYPFRTQNELPKTIQRKPFSIKLKNFPASERSVRILMLDTAFESSGFNDLVTVVDGTVTIDNYMLASVKNGPIILEIYMEQEVPLMEKSLAGGKISITYGVKKEFELTD